jgi:signal transduction histidine kinase
LLDETVDRIRDVITDLYPAVLEDYGLEAALRWYAGQVSQRVGLEVNVGKVAPSLHKSPEAEIALFRIVQEALNNVIKHAQATHVEITLEQLDKMVRLTIADNGAGFNPLQHNGTGKHTGLGLISMAERSEALGGRMWVKSQIGEGTRIIVEVPC